MSVSTTPAEQLFETERKQFVPRLLTNPNYYGNLQNSPFKPVQKIVSNTTYEELKCVGFNPQLSRLEAVVWIKQTTGYDGDICTSGSLEYVSFYLSYDNGATWLPQGTTSFQVFDVPGPHPLEYAVDLRIQTDKTFCFEANLPLVRAILSWNTPPAGPTTTPVWGNAVDTRIQIAPRSLLIPFQDFVKAADLNVVARFAGLVSETATLELAAPKALSPAELQQLYAGTKVPAQRFLHNTIQKAIKNPASIAASSGLLAGLGIDVAAAVAALENPNGNTDYEQLECIGLDEASGSSLDALAGTIRIKLPTGYLGNLCSAGSLEYVAFWIDWGNGWEWAGTASVNVYDIAGIPKEGLNYAVYQPVDLSSHQKPCAAGPVTAKVRAILSWDTPPPPSDPNYVPVWGNRLETLILVDPGVTAQTGNYTPYLTAICDVAVCNIDQTSGFAYPGAGDNPFGASISIYGYIPGAPTLNTILAGNAPLYQITVQQVVGGVLTGSPQVLTDPFGITIDQQIGGALPTSTNVTQNAVAGYFTYQEATPDPVQGWRTVSPQGLLEVWNSSQTGTWQISVVAMDPVTKTSFPAGTTICTLDGTTRQSVVIDLDQLAPVTSLLITGYQPGGVGPCQAAANCQTFTVGDVICGSYSVSDAHLGSFSLSEEPFPDASRFTVDGAATNGLSYPNPALPLAGTKSGVWTFNTAGLPPCGYTIQLLSGDRTIVDCVTNWENNNQFQGFCLVAAPAPSARK